MAKRRFSPRGEAAIKWAELTAAQLGHSYVGSEHLLLGVVRTEDPWVVQALEENRVDEDLLLQALEQQSGSGTAGYFPLQGLTAQARIAILAAAGEALELGQTQMEPLHLLLGILRVPGKRRWYVAGILGRGREPTFYPGVGVGPENETRRRRYDETAGQI